MQNFVNFSHFYFQKFEPFAYGLVPGFLAFVTPSDFLRLSTALPYVKSGAKDGRLIEPVALFATRMFGLTLLGFAGLLTMAWDDFTPIKKRWMLKLLLGGDVLHLFTLFAHAEDVLGGIDSVPFVGQVLISVSLAATRIAYLTLTA